MEIIKQKPAGLGPPRLPDFRNLGVILRVLVLVSLLVVLTVGVRVDEPAELPAALVLMAGQVALPLLLTVLLLYGVAPALLRAGARRAWFAVVGLAVAAALAGVVLVGGDVVAEGARSAVWAALAAMLCLLYLDYVRCRYTPALAEARLLALTARIRPHFFFNSLNGVLGVIRTDPRRAERALEELADLFRALMQDNREQVPLRDELALCERYIDLERLRLGERLHVRWELGEGEGGREALLEARVPPLLLQPLLENAVYHGIEPAAQAGEVVVRLVRHGKELRLEVDNPVCDAGGHHAGNRMALDNIRERLMLFYDLEAGLEINDDGRRYRVRIRLPYRTGGTLGAWNDEA